MIGRLLEYMPKLTITEVKAQVDTHEAVCAERKILICRDTTERPETIEYGYGKLVGTKVLESISFFEDPILNKDSGNPYGSKVSEKIVSILNSLD